MHARAQDSKILLDYREAASSLSMTRSALRDLVYRGKGPPIVKIGRRTYFAVSDLHAWIARHRRTPPRDD